MEIKQISVFLDNTAGRLGEVTRVLADAEINLRAISLADTRDFGILRIIVDKWEAGLKALNDAGFTTRVTDVVALEIEDAPGSLARVMEFFSRSNVNIEYLYASLEGKTGKAARLLQIQEKKPNKKNKKTRFIPL